jgi:DNA-binding MarR family transcriptional regulator
MSISEDSRGDKIEQLLTEIRLMSSFDSLFSHAVAERVGMHQTDIETMDLLNTIGPMTAGELSERTGLTSGATTRLKRAGYVRRCHDQADRRCVIIEPVPENLEALGALFAPLADGMTDLISSLDEQDLDRITRFMRQSNALIAGINARLRAGPGEAVDGTHD